MSASDSLNIRESDPKYAIDKLKAGSEAAKELYNKQIEIYEMWARYWQNRLSVGKKCMNYMRRDIFTREEREFYEDVQEKIPIEPQEMKPVIDSMVGMITQTVRGSSVTMEDGDPPETVARPETVAKTLKWWQNRLKVKRTQEIILREGLITGYPVWVWVDKERMPGGGYGEAVATRPRWDSVLSYPYFENVDGSDINEVIRLYDRDYNDMYRQFPERKKEHQKHLEFMSDDDFKKRYWPLDERLNSGDRHNVIYNRVMSATADKLEGRSLIIERYHPVYEEVQAFVNEETNDFQVIPPEWPPYKADAWQKRHPEYNLIITDEIPTLWVTTTGSDGFIWGNAKHWYQENGELPGKCYIADMIDGMPTGKGDDMVPYVLQIAVSETEGLHQVRTGTGTVVGVTEGSLKHPSRFEREMSKANGVLVFKKGNSAKDSMHVVQRKPNDTYHIMADRSREQLREVTAVNSEMRGETLPRQSNKAKQTALAAGLNPQSPYVLNYAEFVMGFAQLLVNMMPYCLTTEMIVEIEDEWGAKSDPETVNQTEYDNVSGEAFIVANDLTAIPYRIVPVPGDDSLTTRQKELEEFAGLLEAIGNTLLQIDPDVLASMLSGWPNRYARELGESLKKFAARNQIRQEQAAEAEQQLQIAEAESKNRVEMEKIRKPRFNIRLSPQDLNEAPIGTKLFLQLLNGMNQPQEIPEDEEPQPPEEEIPQGEPLEQMAV